MSSDGIEILEVSREPIAVHEMIKMAGWSWGDEGKTIARLWSALNQAHFGGKLNPLPVWFPRAMPHGGCVGMFCGGTAGGSLSIQIQYGLSLQEKADVLFHEMIHQYLFETKQRTQHNSKAWCGEIMRLAKEIWGVDIWASPADPRKVLDPIKNEMVTKRIQKPSPNGVASIPRAKIATFPHSLGLSISVSDYL